MAAGRVRGTMTERKAASAGDRWNSRPLALSRFRSRSFSLRLRRIYSRSRARARTHVHASRVHAYRDVRGFLSFVTANSRLPFAYHTPGPGLGPLDRRRRASFKLSDRSVSTLSSADALIDPLSDRFELFLPLFLFLFPYLFSSLLLFHSFFSLGWDNAPFLLRLYTEKFSRICSWKLLTNVF